MSTVANSQELDPVDSWDAALQDRDEDEQKLLNLLFETLGFDDLPTMCDVYDYFRDTCDITNDQGWDDHHSPGRAEVGQQLAQVAGLPHDPDLFEQPFDMERMVKAVVNTESCSSDNDDEIQVNRILYPLVACSFWLSLKTYPFEKALDRIRVAGIQCLREFGPTNPVRLRIKLEAFLAKVQWFRDTDGFHRPDGSIDVEAAAMRAYLRGDIE